MNKRRLIEKRLIDIMKFSLTQVILMAVFAAWACATDVNGQKILEKKISIEADQKEIKLILAEIEKKAGVRFAYSSELNTKKEMTISAIDRKLSDILDDLFASDVEYTVNRKQIILKLKKVSTEASLLNEAGTIIDVVDLASIIIAGKVSDENSQPMPGVNVLIKGTTIGTSTDSQGIYKLSVPDENASGTLVFSFIGYLSEEVAINNQTIIDMSLVPDLMTLQEVVVVGYGEQRKVNVTGSVASINTKDITNRVNTNVLSSIQGAIPGVTIISRPGQAPSINFRGRGNLGTSEPLFVLDGIIIDAGTFSNLNQNIIESISFLKDAASSSIYGSRAAYGVVLITTKKGERNKFAVSYNGLTGVKTPTYMPDLVDSWDYATLWNEGLVNRGRPAYYTPDQIATFKNGSDPDNYPNSKWYDLVLQKSVVTTQHSLNFSGGTDKLRYFTDLGYLYDNQFMPGQDNRRYNLNTKITADVTKWLTLKTNVNYIRTENDQNNGIPALSVMHSVPSIYVAKESNGEWGSIAGGVPASTTTIQRNPLRSLSKNNWFHGNGQTTIIDLGFDLKPIKGLVITGQAAYRGIENKGKSYNALQDNVKAFPSGTEIAGTGTYINGMSVGWSTSTRMMYVGTAKYDFTKGEHEFSVLAGTSYERGTSESLSASRKNFPTDALVDLNAGSSAGEDITNGGGLSEIKLSSYFGRINYSFRQRYLVEANIRSDGTSRFSQDYRTGVFPSFSAGWRVSEESFMKSVSWVENLKLRGSYGTLGNINNVGNYDYFQNYNTNLGYNFNNQAVQGVSESKPANTKLSWEKVAMTDVGLDAEILNGKIALSADYYVKTTSDILLGYNVPVEVGTFTRPSQNIGKVENRGLELALTYKNTIGNWNYSISGNIASNQNKVLDLATSDNLIQGGGDKVNYIFKVGESIGSYYGYKTDGLYSQAEIDAGQYYVFGRIPKAGDIKYLPQRSGVNYKDAMTGEDRRIIGSDVPKFTYGLNFRIQYKNIELFVLGQGISGAVVAFETDAIETFGEGITNPRRFHLERWTTENPNPQAIFPRIYGGNSLDDYNKRFSEYSLFNADYFRFKTISVGYRVPESIIKKLNINTLRFFVTMENMFTLRGDQKMKDFDPENAQGRTLGLGTKTVALGVNLSF
jgi:TonB-linked SusC/RagA family outer membrane protein